MKTWLALTALLLVVAPGCGDDTTMAVGPDMSAVSSDMTKTCASVLACAIGCLSQTNPVQCAGACELGTSTTVMGYFNPLFGCIANACLTDGGTSGLLACAQQQIGSGGACETKYNICKNN